MYSFLTLISFIGCGVIIALILVSIIPLYPDSNIRSPSFKVPETNITSIVVPRPSIFLTSKTVQFNSVLYSSLYLSFVVVYFITTPNKSGIPSPVTPEVGIIEV
jgi:hypothetical protein